MSSLTLDETWHRIAFLIEIYLWGKKKENFCISLRLKRHEGWDASLLHISRFVNITPNVRKVFRVYAWLGCRVTEATMWRAANSPSFYPIPESECLASLTLETGCEPYSTLYISLYYSDLNPTRLKLTPSPFPSPLHSPTMHTPPLRLYLSLQAPHPT